MTTVFKGRRRTRNPVATRADLIDTTCVLLAKDGIKGISLSKVASFAKVNRSWAYNSFNSREQLINETLAHVSDRLYRAVLGDPNQSEVRRIEQVDMIAVTASLANFAMEYPELCQVWLHRILSAPNPSSDPFWREFSESIGRFAATDLAEPDIDVEVFSIILLAGTFLWPVWARSNSQSAGRRNVHALRFVHEILRLSLHGTLRSDSNTDLATRAVDLARPLAPPGTG